MLPLSRTLGGHRRYQRDMVRARLGAESAVTGKTVCNARVSSHNQTEQRKTQASRLQKHCIEAGSGNIDVISDLCSGLNYRKKGCSTCCRRGGSRCCVKTPARDEATPFCQMR